MYRELVVCTWSCFFLKLSLMWPTKKEEVKPSKWFYIRLIMFLFYSTLTFSSLIFMHFFKSLEIEDGEISETLALLAAVVGLDSMMVLFAVKQKKLLTLLRDLSDFKQFGKPPGFDMINKRGDRIATFVFFYGIFGTTMYTCYKLLQFSECKANSKIREICGTLAPIWTPFPVDNSLLYFLLSLNAYALSVILSKITLLVSAQVLEIASHLKVRIDQLKMMLETCFDGDVKDDEKRLNDCIRYHIDIIDYSERFNDCFTNNMFVHFTTTGVICGCLENQIVKQKDIGSILHIMGWITALFVSCLGGQILMDSSLSIAEAAYNSKWYQTDVRLRKKLILIMMRSQKALFVSTGPFNVLCLALFVAIMKMSYSILTLLN